MKTAAIVIAITSILGVGWLIYDRNENQTRQTTQQTQNEEQTQENTTTDETYFTIKEWGVKFKLPEELQDNLSYGIQKPKDQTEVEVASFEIKQLTQLPRSNCGLFNELDGSGASGGSGVRLIRNSHQASSAESYSLRNILNNGNYWFHSSLSKGSCLKDQTNGQLEVNLTTLLNNSFQSLEVNNN